MFAQNLSAETSMNFGCTKLQCVEGSEDAEDGMSELAERVELDGNISWEQVRDVLVNGVNLAWRQDGNDARLFVTANFVGWAIQDNDRLRARVAELEAERDEWKQCAEVEAEVRREFKQIAETAEARVAELVALLIQVVHCGGQCDAELLAKIERATPEAGWTA